MDTLKICFFGAFSLSLGGHTICEANEKGDKQWRLVKYLILNRKRAVEKRELIDAVFGYGAYSQRTDEALNALNATVHRARKLMSRLSEEASQMISYSNGAYRVLLPESCEIDSDMFDLFSEKVFSSGNVSEIKSYALKICGIYRGFFLDKSFSEEWARILAEKYHASYKRIFSILCGILRREGDFETIYTLSERASAIDPICEDFRFERLRALYEAGERKRACEVYLDVLTFFENALSVPLSERFREFGSKLIDVDRDIGSLSERIFDRRSKFITVPTDLFEEYASFTVGTLKKRDDISIHLAEAEMSEGLSEEDITLLKRALATLTELAIISPLKSEKGFYLLFGSSGNTQASDIPEEIKRILGKKAGKIEVLSV